MKGRKDEAETIVRFDQKEQVISICVSCWPSMCRKMTKLYGDRLKKSGDQVAYWKIPIKSITFRSLAAMSAKRRVPTSGFKRRTGPRSGDLDFGNKESH